MVWTNKCVIHWKMVAWGWELVEGFLLRDGKAPRERRVQFVSFKISPERVLVRVGPAPPLRPRCWAPAPPGQLL